MASEKITAIVEAVKGLTILELAELVKVVEAEFGVSAAAPVGVAAAAAGPAAPEVEEKTEFDVILAEFANKLGVIKVVREITGLASRTPRTLSSQCRSLLRKAHPRKRLRKSGSTHRGRRKVEIK